MEQVNLLDLIPIRNREWEELDSEHVVILDPKFKNKILAKWLLPRLKNPYFRVKLDAYGSWVWSQCDGQTTVRQIGISLRERFGEGVEPVYERLRIFLRVLERNKFIILRQQKTPGIC